MVVLLVAVSHSFLKLFEELLFMIDRILELAQLRLAALLLHDRV